MLYRSYFFATIFVYVYIFQLELLIIFQLTLYQVNLINLIIYLFLFSYHLFKDLLLYFPLLFSMVNFIQESDGMLLYLCHNLYILLFFLNSSHCQPAHAPLVYSGVSLLYGSSYLLQSYLTFYILLLPFSLCLYVKTCKFLFRLMSIQLFICSKSLLYHLSTIYKNMC